MGFDPRTKYLLRIYQHHFTDLTPFYLWTLKVWTLI